MYKFILEIITMSAMFGLIAAVYHTVLSKEPILNWWFMIGLRFEKWFFYRAVWGCVKCIAGQFTLWFYLYIVVIPLRRTETGQFWHFPEMAAQWTYGGAALILGHILAVCGAILFSLLFSKLFRFIND